MKKKSVNKNGSMKKDLKAKLAIKYVIVYEVIHYTLEEHRASTWIILMYVICKE